MGSQFRVKPSKENSMLGMIVGIVFIIVGITMASQIGAFGILWTVFAFIITGYHALNVFSKNGVSAYEADFDHDGYDVQSSSTSSIQDHESKIRQLHRLREDNIITEEEYQKKKTELLDSEW